MRRARVIQINSVNEKKQKDRGKWLGLEIKIIKSPQVGEHFTAIALNSGHFAWSTSLVKHINLLDNGFILTTKNSIYTFEYIEDKEVKNDIQ